MEWRRRAERTRVVRQVAALVEESEAFLLGRYLETRARSAAGSPVWTRCNWIAHAAPDEIMAAVAGPARLSGRPGSWAWAAGTLADELIRLAGGEPGAVGDLQRGCLVPLELTLMEPAFWNVLPADVVALARTRLRAHPRARRDGLRVPPGDEE